MKMKLLLAVALGLALLAITSAVALSWSDVDPTSGFGPDFMVSLPLDDQADPSVAYNPDDDEYLVVWEDKRGSDTDVYGQILSASGVPQGDNFVVSDASDEQSYPHAAYNSTDKNYMVVWRDKRGGAGSYDVYGQAINATGILSGTNFAINTDADDQKPYGLVYDPNADHYLVVWVDEGQDQIEGQLLDPAGALLPPNAFTIAVDGEYPRVAYDSNLFSYVVVYQHEEAAGNRDIYGQAIAGDGSISDPAFVICNNTADQTLPNLEFNSSTHEYLVVWQDGRNSATGTDLYARRINQDGAPQGSEIVISNALDAQNGPDVAYNSRVNQWLVAWEDYRNRNASGVDVYGQRVLSTGNLAPQGNFAIYDGPNNQGSVALAARPTQTGAEYLAAWEDQRSHDGLEVVGQRIGAAFGTLNWHNFNVSAPLGSQENPHTVYNPNAQQFFVVWQDGRENEWGIYGQIVLTTGIPITDNIVVQDEDHALAEPAVAYSTISNAYMVVWDDQGAGDIERRIVNADGTLGTAQDVFGGAITVTQPALAYNSAANEYLVVFAYRASATNQDIYGQRVAPNGTLNGTAFPICNDATNQLNPDVVYNAADNEYLVVWYDERNFATTGWNIYGQRVTASGSVTGAPIPVSTAARDQYDPSVTWNSDDDEYLVVWRDGRNFESTKYDIYGQRIDADGVPRGEVPIVTTNGTQTAPHANYIVTLKRYFVTWADDRNAVPPTWDIYGQNVNPDGSLYGGLVAFFVFSGDQQRPDGDFSPEANRGLTVWQDGRNGTTYKIYGRIKEPRFAVYLPLVLRNTQ